MGASEDQIRRGAAALTTSTEVAPQSLGQQAVAVAGATIGDGGDGRSRGSAGHHLCADCDVYVTLEPCAMCAMALVHSRVRRLVYALPARHGGALGSTYELHVQRSLNHHFAVIRGLLRGEAEAAGLAHEDALEQVGG